MPHIRPFPSYSPEYANVFLRAEESPEIILLSSLKAANNLRYRLYAFRTAALSDLDALEALGTDGARLALLLPLARLSIATTPTGATLKIDYRKETHSHVQSKTAISA